MITSVISQAVAIDLQHELVTSQDPLHTTRYHGCDLTIQIRRSYRRQRATGGLLLTVYGPEPAWSHAGFNYQRSERLRPGYTARQFQAAVDRLMRWPCLEVERIQYVEVVYRAEQRSNLSDAMRDAVTAEEKRLGRDSSFDTMSIEDAQHWDRWMGEWWRNHPQDHKSTEAR